MLPLLLTTLWLSTSTASAQEGEETTTTTAASTSSTSSTLPPTTTSSTLPEPSIGESAIVEEMRSERTEQGFALSLLVFSAGMLCGIKTVR